jgi:hypothetical protein
VLLFHSKAGYYTIIQLLYRACDWKKVTWIKSLCTVHLCIYKQSFKLPYICKEIFINKQTRPLGGYTSIGDPCQQYCGSMIFWCGSGSGSGFADSCLWLIDPDWDPDVDPDPAIFVIDLQDAKDKKVKKNLQSSRNQGFSYYFYYLYRDRSTGQMNCFLLRIRLEIQH